MAQRNKSGGQLRSRDVVGSTAQKHQAPAPVEGGVLVEAVGRAGLTAGFYDGKRRRTGEQFVFHGKKLGRWMKPVDASAPVASAADDKTPGPPTGNMNVLGG